MPAVARLGMLVFYKQAAFELSETASANAASSMATANMQECLMATN